MSGETRPAVLDAPHGASAAFDATRGRRLYHAGLLVVLPLVQIAINPALFINPAGNSVIDPWVYNGFFQSLPEYLHRFGNMYYATRLSWLLPGFAAYSIFPPLVANYVLHIGFAYILIFATYGLVARSAPPTIAMVAALLVAWQPGILAALSWDYVDGAAIVFLVLTLFCLDRAVAGGSRPGLWGAGAGAAAMCLVTANLFLIALLPACAAFALVRRTGPCRWVAVVVAPAALGACAMFVLFAAANRALGGGWLFIAPSIRFARQLNTVGNLWRAPRLSWIRAPWLIFPCAGVVGVVSARLMRVRAASALRSSMHAAFFMASAVWILIDLVTSSTLLESPWYVSYLAPLAVLAIVLQADEPPFASNARSAVVFELAVVGALAITHYAFLRTGGVWATHRVFVNSLSAAGAVAGAVALSVIRDRRAAWTVFLAGFCLSCGVLSHDWPVLGAGNARDDLQQTTLAHRFIAQHVGARAMRIWHPPISQGSPPFRPIAATYLWDYVLVNEKLPRIDAAAAARLTPDTRLFLLVQYDSEAIAAEAALQPLGLGYRPVVSRAFGAGGRAFRVIAGDLVKLQASAIAAQARPGR